MASFAKARLHVTSRSGEAGNPNVNTDRRHKWWGWGSEGTKFDSSARPAFWPWVRSVVTLPDRPVFPPMPLEQIQLPTRRIHAPFEDAVVLALGKAAVRGDDAERLRHAYGRSLRDLIRLAPGSSSASRTWSSIPRRTSRWRPSSSWPWSTGSA